MLLHLFGTPRIIADDQPLRGLPDKAFVAIALLAVKFDGVASRAVLAGHLWENHTTNSANANLRQMLAGVRRFETKYGLSILNADRSLVYLHDGMPSDLEQYNTVVSFKETNELKQYVCRLQEEFLQSLEDVGGEDLRLWILTHRHDFTTRFLRIARESALHIGGRNGAEALEFLLTIHPYNEELLRALVLTHSQNNDYAATLRCFNDYKTQLKRDLGVSPSEKTLNFLARVAPELISDLERDFSFLSKSPTKISASIGAGNFPDTGGGKPRQSLPRLIILPPANETFGLGPTDQTVVNCMVEDLTLCLCRMRSFVVLAPHTARQFVKPSQSQTAFDVDYVISTRLLSTRRTRNLAICLTLLPTGEVLMAEVIPVEAEEIFDSFTYFIQSLANRIGFAIDNSVLLSFKHTGTVSAYTYYLIGKHRLSIDNLPSVRAARRAFRRALQLAPDFYQARQMLAHTYNREWWLLGRIESDLLLEAQRIAESLVEIDPLAPGGHWEFGTCILYQGDIDGALERFDLAVSFAPHHADIIAEKADAHIHNGQYSQALTQIDVALFLNPLPPDEYHWIKASAQFFIGNYQASLDSALESKVRPPSHLRFLASCYSMLGDLKKANYFRKMFLSEYPDFKINDWLDMFPAKKQSDANRYADALRRAGFC